MKVKYDVAVGVAVVKALEDRYALKVVSDKDAKIIWQWLYDNEPTLADKVQKLGSASAAAAWHKQIKEALYGDIT